MEAGRHLIHIEVDLRDLIHMNVVEAVQVGKQLIQSFFIRSHGETPFIHLLYSIKNYMTRGKDDFKQKAHHPGTISRMVRFRLFILLY